MNKSTSIFLFEFQQLEACKEMEHEKQKTRYTYIYIYMRKNKIQD